MRGSLVKSAAVAIVVIVFSGCAPFVVTQQLRGQTQAKHYIYPPGAYPNAPVRATVRLSAAPAPGCTGNANEFFDLRFHRSVFSGPVASVQDRGKVPPSKEAFDDALTDLWQQAGSCGQEAHAALGEKLWARMPRTFADDLRTRYGLVGDEGRVDLHPGMRVRIEWQVFIDSIKDRGYVGSGSSYLQVSRKPESDRLTFETLFAWLPTKVERMAGNPIAAEFAGSVDLEGEPLPRKLYRVVWPPNGFGSAFQPDQATGSHAALIGADDAVTLEAATKTFLQDHTCPPEVAVDGAVCTLFAGRSVPIPEIRIRAGGKGEYLSLGTTVLQLADRDSRRVRGQQLPMTRLHHGRRRNVLVQPPYGDHAFDLPLVHGDEIR